jgi:hypothetical protein
LTPPVETPGNYCFHICSTTSRRARGINGVVEATSQSIAAAIEESRQADGVVNKLTGFSGPITAYMSKALIQYRSKCKEKYEQAADQNLFGFVAHGTNSRRALRSADSPLARGEAASRA